MIVYSLNYKNNPSIPFYIGITDNLQRRFKQHQTAYKKHKPYIRSKDDFFIKKLFDTGSNKYSLLLAEEIETKLIKFYNTVNHGSNKVYNIRKYVNNHFSNENEIITPEDKIKSIQKAKQTHIIKQHKKFKKVIKLIKYDPCRYSINEIILKTPFTSLISLNNYTKKYHNVKFKDWLETYQKLWLNYIVEWNKNYS